MYSVMKNQNRYYVKTSSHAMSSFHVLHLSKNAKVPILFLIFLGTVMQIVTFWWWGFFYLFKSIKCNLFLNSWGRQIDYSSCL